MREKRLLERLRAMEQNPDWRGESDPGQAVASVLDHLGKILNTRQGSAPISPDLGMPDFTSLSGLMGEKALPQMEAVLTQVIHRYEPRLVDVHAHFDPRPDRPFLIAFKLVARVRVENLEMPVVFETVLNPDGRITVLE